MDLCEFKASLVYIVPGQPELQSESLSQKTNKQTSNYKRERESLLIDLMSQHQGAAQKGVS